MDNPLSDVLCKFAHPTDLIILLYSLLLLCRMCSCKIAHPTTSINLPFCLHSYLYKKCYCLLPVCASAHHPALGVWSMIGTSLARVCCILSFTQFHMLFHTILHTFFHTFSHTLSHNCTIMFSTIYVIWVISAIFGSISTCWVTKCMYLSLEIQWWYFHTHPHAISYNFHKWESDTFQALFISV